MKTVAQVGDATLTDDTENVRLKCSAHTKAEWCPEMELMMKNSLDHPSVDAIAEPTEVTVPLMPSRDYWAMTEVRPIHVGGMHEFYIRVRIPKDDGLHLAGEYSDEYVGMIAPGEGRNAMRLILFEWLKFKFITVPPCSSRVHPRGDIFGPRAGRQERYTEPTAVQLCITHDLLTMGICQACAVLADTSHDIPEGV